MFVLSYTVCKLVYCSVAFQFLNKYSVLLKCVMSFVVKIPEVHMYKCNLHKDDITTPVMRLCNYSLVNAIVFLIKMLAECKYMLLHSFCVTTDQQIKILY